jgi:hypothetical protein
VSARLARGSLIAVLRRTVLLTLCVGGLVGVLASCSSEESTSSPQPLPAIDGIRLQDLATGEQTELAAALDDPNDTPVVACFWAPF